MLLLDGFINVDLLKQIGLWSLKGLASRLVRFINSSTETLINLDEGCGMQQAQGPSTQNVF